MTPFIHYIAFCPSFPVNRNVPTYRLLGQSKCNCSHPCSPHVATNPQFASVHFWYCPMAGRGGRLLMNGGFSMKKMSWILSALAMAALTSTSTAQEPKAMPAAPTVSTPPVYLGNGCCGTAGCDTGCCNSCCDRRGGIIADVGFMILTPKFS